MNMGRRARPVGYEYNTPEGYIKVKVPTGEGKGLNSAWEFKHRLVMEQVIGRKLLKTERVHHINGNPQDNRPENLELCDNEARHKELHFGASHVFICKYCGNEFKLAPHIVRNRLKFNGTPPMYCNNKCQKADQKGKPFPGIPGHPKGGHRKPKEENNNVAAAI